MRGRVALFVVEPQFGTQASSARSMSPVTSGSHASPTVIAAVVWGVVMSSACTALHGLGGALDLFGDVQALILRDVWTWNSDGPPRAILNDILGPSPEDAPTDDDAWPRSRGLVPGLFLAALLVLGGLALAALRARRPLPPTIVFYGFSILADVMEQASFRRSRRASPRKEEAGRVHSSFGGSGTVTNQVIMGVPAELVLLSLESDAARLADAGVVPPGSWKSLPHAGVVNLTPFIILVRKENPRGIRDFEDLTRPGTRIVHPDPLTSGGANWAIVAEYGAGFGRAGRRLGRRSASGGVWKNVVAQASSARAARTQFEQGFGDALITYEQEAGTTAAGAAAGRHRVPKRTILSEHTLVVVGRNVPSAHRPLVDRFARFLWTEKRSASS